MGKVKLKVSVEKITFEYEGDHETGMAVNRAMNATFGSLMEAHNRVTDVAPAAPSIRTPLPAPATPARRKRRRPKASATDAGILLNTVAYRLMREESLKRPGASAKDLVTVVLDDPELVELLKRSLSKDWGPDLRSCVAEGS